MPKIVQTPPPPGILSSSRYFMEVSLDSMVIMYGLTFSPTHCAGDTMKVKSHTTRSQIETEKKRM